MQFPENLKYTKDHEWILIEGNKATIGITDFAQSELGDIVYVDINSLGKTMKKEEVFGTIEAVKTVSDLFMPVSGVINTINEELNNAPESVNKDPYGSGWIIKITLTNADELTSLMSAAEYRASVSA